MQLVVFIGIQATGKSAFFGERFASSHVRLNLDLLKTRRREAILFDACLRSKTRTVIDNTNPTRADRARYVAPAKQHRFEVVGYFFQSRIDDALRRNAARQGKARVDDRGIRATSARLQLPSPDEGFDKLYFVRLEEQAGRFDVLEWQDDEV